MVDSVVPRHMHGCATMVVVPFGRQSPNTWNEINLNNAIPRTKIYPTGKNDNPPSNAQEGEMPQLFPASRGAKSRPGDRQNLQLPASQPYFAANCAYMQLIKLSTVLHTIFSFRGEQLNRATSTRPVAPGSPGSRQRFRGSSILGKSTIAMGNLRRMLAKVSFCG